MNWDHKLFFKINGLVGKNNALDVLGFFGARFLLFIMIIIVPFLYYSVNFRHASLPWLILRIVPLFIQLWFFSWIINLLVGAMIKRPRPYIFYENKVKSLFTPLFEKWKSMPSDHAMTCAVLLMIIVFSRSFFNVILFLLLSLWVCWGRIYSGVHYPSDIIVGFLIGTVVPFVVMLIAGAISSLV